MFLAFSYNFIYIFITNAPSYVSSFTLHTDIKIKAIHEEPKTYYKDFSTNILPTQTL